MIEVDENYNKPDPEDPSHDKVDLRAYDFFYF
jgi:hypothetical protein